MTSPVNFEYASGAVDVRVLLRCLRIARWCALVPMTVGLLTLALYWATDEDFFRILGLFWLPLGAILVVTGFVYAVLGRRYIRLEAAQSGKPPRAATWRILALLLLNVPIALFSVVAGIMLEVDPRVFVKVTNDTGARIDECSISSTWSVGSATALDPGASTSRGMKARFAGGLSVHVRQGSTGQDIAIALPQSSSMIDVSVKGGLNTVTQIHSRGD